MCIVYACVHAFAPVNVGECMHVYTCICGGERLNGCHMSSSINFYLLFLRTDSLTGLRAHRLEWHTR